MELGIEHRLRHGGLEQGEDTGAAAALVAVGQRQEGEAGYFGQQRERLVNDPLRVLEMAGRVVNG
jgi:hypothetical protein